MINSKQSRKLTSHGLLPIEGTWDGDVRYPRESKRYAQMANDMKVFRSNNRGNETEFTSKLPKRKLAPDTFSKISSTLGFQHHEGTDHALELDVMKIILKREGLLMNLRHQCDHVFEQGTVAKSCSHILELLSQLREITLIYLDALLSWRKSALNNDPNNPLQFKWENTNYTVKIINDLDFLAENPTIVKALNSVEQGQLQSNPLMLANNLEDEFTWMDPRERAIHDSAGEKEGPYYDSRLRLRNAERLLLQEIEAASSPAGFSPRDQDFYSGNNHRHASPPAQQAQYYNLDQRQQQLQGLRHEGGGGGGYDYVAGGPLPLDGPSHHDLMTGFIGKASNLDNSTVDESEYEPSRRAESRGDYEPDYSQQQLQLGYGRDSDAYGAGVSSQQQQQQQQQQEMGGNVNRGYYSPNGTTNINTGRPPSEAMTFHSYGGYSTVPSSSQTDRDHVPHSSRNSGRDANSPGFVGGPVGLVGGYGVVGFGSNQPASLNSFAYGHDFFAGNWAYDPSMQTSSYELGEQSMMAAGERQAQLIQQQQQRSQQESTSFVAEPRLDDLASTTRSIDSVDPDNVMAVLSIRHPPRNLVLAASASVVILGTNSELPSDVSWEAFLQLCKTMDVAHAMSKLNPINVPYYKVKAIKPFLDELSQDTSQVEDSAFLDPALAATAKIITWVKQFISSAERKHAKREMLAMMSDGHGLEHPPVGPAGSGPGLRHPSSKFLEPLQIDRDPAYAASGRGKLQRNNNNSTRGGGGGGGDVGARGRAQAGGSRNAPLSAGAEDVRDSYGSRRGTRGGNNSAGSAGVVPKIGMELYPFHTEMVENKFPNPLLLIMLTSTDFTQQGVDPATAPAPERLVAKVFDVIESKEASLNIHMREYVLFLQELNIKYQALASKYFKPTEVLWWRKHLRKIIFVKLRVGGTLYLAISKSSIDKLVQRAIRREVDKENGADEDEARGEREDGIDGESDRDSDGICANGRALSSREAEALDSEVEGAAGTDSDSALHRADAGPVAGAGKKKTKGLKKRKKKVASTSALPPSASAAAAGNAMSASNSTGSVGPRTAGAAVVKKAGLHTRRAPAVAAAATRTTADKSAAIAAAAVQDTKDAKKKGPAASPSMSATNKAAARKKPTLAPVATAKTVKVRSSPSTSAVAAKSTPSTPNPLLPSALAAPEAETEAVLPDTGADATATTSPPPASTPLSAEVGASTAESLQLPQTSGTIAEGESSAAAAVAREDGPTAPEESAGAVGEEGTQRPQTGESGFSGNYDEDYEHDSMEGEGDPPIADTHAPSDPPEATAAATVELAAQQAPTSTPLAANDSRFAVENGLGGVGNEGETETATSIAKKSDAVRRASIDAIKQDLVSLDSGSREMLAPTTAQPSSASRDLNEESARAESGDVDTGALSETVEAADKAAEALASAEKAQALVDAVNAVQEMGNDHEAQMLALVIDDQSLSNASQFSVGDSVGSIAPLHSQQQLGVGVGGAASRAPLLERIPSVSVDGVGATSPMHVSPANICAPAGVHFSADAADASNLQGNSERINEGSAEKGSAEEGDQRGRSGSPAVAAVIKDVAASAAAHNEQHAAQGEREEDEDDGYGEYTPFQTPAKTPMRESAGLGLDDDDDDDEVLDRAGQAPLAETAGTSSGQEEPALVEPKPVSAVPEPAAVPTALSSDIFGSISADADALGDDDDDNDNNNSNQPALAPSASDRRGGSSGGGGMDTAANSEEDLYDLNFDESAKPEINIGDAAAAAGASASEKNQRCEFREIRQQQEEEQEPRQEKSQRNEDDDGERGGERGAAVGEGEEDDEDLYDLDLEDGEDGEEVQELEQEQEQRGKSGETTERNAAAVRGASVLEGDEEDGLPSASAASGAPIGSRDVARSAAEGGSVEFGSIYGSDFEDKSSSVLR